MEHICNNDSFGEGWFSYPTLYSEIVQKFPTGSRFVEVGSWKGKSSAYMAVEIINSQKDIEFFCVDTWEGSVEHKGMEDLSSLYDIFISNMLPVQDHYFPLKITSLEAAKKFKDKSLDFVFIDASHEYEDIKNDIIAWYPKIKEGGVLAGHDFYVEGYDWYPGVKKAVKEILPSYSVSENCWIHYKIKEDKLKNFPPVHFISVDYSIERRKSLYEKLNKFGIVNITEHIFEKYKEEDHIIKTDYDDKLGVGSRGPVTSHLKAIRKWYESTSEEIAFFCEDDLSMELVQYWNFTWEEFYNSIPSDWEIVQLSWLREEIFNAFRVGFRNRCWCDWSGCAYIIKRSFAKKLIDAYYFDETFNLFLQGNDVHLRDEWAKIPVIETIIFSPLGQVYGAPLFTEDLSFLPSYSDPCTEEGKAEYVHYTHYKSYMDNLNWWKSIGCNQSITEFMGL
jgi:hypothetical protein